jgi:hypothetical protein
MSEGKSVVRTEYGVTILDEQSELVIQVQEKLTGIATDAEPGIVALDIQARFQRATFAMLQAAKLKPRDQQHLYSIGLRQFLTDPIPESEE